MSQVTSRCSASERGELVADARCDGCVGAACDVEDHERTLHPLAGASEVAEIPENQTEVAEGNAA